MKLLKFIKNYVNITVCKVAVAHSVNLYFYRIRLNATPFRLQWKAIFLFSKYGKKLIQQRNLVNF